MRSGNTARSRSSCKIGAGCLAAADDCGTVDATGDGFLSGAPVRISSRNETDGGRGSVETGVGGLFAGIRFWLGSVVVGAMGGLEAV